jgi:hypothetical protein
LSLFLVLIVLVVVAGVVARFLLPRGSARRDDADVTDRAVRPPAHPDEAVPGSEPHRRQQDLGARSARAGEGHEVRKGRAPGSRG